MVAGNKFPPEFGDRIDHGVDLASDLLLRCMDRGNHIGKCHVPHDEQVHVAAAALIAARKRAVDERQSNPVRERRKGGAKDLGHARRLRHQFLQFPEDRTGRVCPVENLVSAHAPLEHASCGQSPYFALNGARSDRGGAGDLAKIECLVGVTKKPSQNGAAGLAEKRR